MKKLTCVLALAGAGWLGGCGREGGVPPDSFALTVREVVADADTTIAVLDIRAGRDASISVDGETFHSQVVLPAGADAEARAGEVVLSSARIAPSGGGKAYIQALIRPRARGGYAGGASVYPVAAETKLADFFSIAVTSGVYKLDAPVRIVQMQGKPVTLVVGKPTK